MLNILRRHRRFALPLLSILFCVVLAVGIWSSLPTASTDAAIDTWIRGASIVPRSSEDFASESFRQSVWNLKQAGATHVGLVVPWYQTSINSTDVKRGPTTPSDSALVAAIDYAHSIGLKVVIKFHVEAGDYPWRAHINPTDRRSWFQAYGDALVHTGQLAQSRQAEMFSIGTELIFMAEDARHPTNTANWRAMIARVRAVYPGALTYGALGNGDEDHNVRFWDALDYISTSPYYRLDADAEKSVASLKASWEKWYQLDIKPLANYYKKPIFFGEIGFRSLTNVHIDPWNYDRQGSANEADQARNYLAMMSALKDKPEFAGIMLWDWDSNPAVGGPADTNFTPYGKQAEQVMRYLWGDMGSQVTASVQSYSTTREGEPLDIDSYLLNLGSHIGGVNVDVEVYDGSGRMVHQEIFSSVDLPTEVMKRVSFEFIPKQLGEYRVSVGVFSSDWSQLYTWGHHRGRFSAVNNPSTMRITLPVPTVLRQYEIYNLRWTDNVADEKYNLLLRAVGGKKQWAIEWMARPTTNSDGTRSYNWIVGEVTDAVLPIPGEYYFTVCHDYTAPCTVSSIFRLEAGVPPASGLSIVGEASSGLGVRLRNNSSASASTLVDLELYDNANQKVAQKYFDNEGFAAGETREFTFDSLSLPSAGSPYRFHVGIFQPAWQGLLHWFHDVKVFESIP